MAPHQTTTRNPGRDLFARRLRVGGGHTLVSAEQSSVSCDINPWGFAQINFNYLCHILSSAFLLFWSCPVSSVTPLGIYYYYHYHIHIHQMWSDKSTSKHPMTLFGDNYHQYHSKRETTTTFTNIQSEYILLPKRLQYNNFGRPWHLLGTSCRAPFKSPAWYESGMDGQTPSWMICGRRSEIRDPIICHNV